MTIHFTTWVEYGDRSATGGCAGTLPAARDVLARDVKFYADMDYPIRVAYIQEVCARCNNEGKVNIPHKRNKYLYKVRPCPDCKGTPPTLREDWEVNND